MAIRLTGFSFGVTPRIPGVRSGDIASINDVSNPPAALKDWRLAVRGGAVFFISPPGWTPANQTRPKDQDPAGPVIVHEIPRSEIYLQWDSDENDVEIIAKTVNKFESKPFGWKPAPIVDDKPILEQIPPGQTGDA